MARSRSSNGTTTANLGFEAKLWLAADKLRSNMDAAEYKHVVLGLIFLKYISDTFEEHRAKLVAGKGDYKGSDPEDPDEYRAENVFWVPADACWSHLQASAKQPSPCAASRPTSALSMPTPSDATSIDSATDESYAEPISDTAKALWDAPGLAASIPIPATPQHDETGKTAA